LKSKKGYSLVEVVIALTVIIVVSATALTVVLYSISLRHAEINKSEAQNFAENMVECFKAANQDGLTPDEKKEEFFRLVEFAEGATFEQEDPHFPDIYTYTSETKKFIVGVNINYTDSDKTLDLPEVPERVGYSGSWIYDEAPGDKVATAVYEPNVYKINYEGLFGASNMNNPKEYTIETGTFSIAPPSSNADSFIGWYLDRECTTPAPETVAKGSYGEITVYAKWNCDHDHVGTVKVKPLALKEGIMTYNCKNCLNSYEAPIPATKSIKLLSIGNSFSVDATEYLWKLCAFAGVVDLVVGRMHIGGCSLNTHMSNIESGENAYTYQKSTKGC
jgi:uncharacterized repeat protein (TIGR02543 family)